MTFLFRSNGKILLQRRATRVTFPGCRDSSSSFHFTFGESDEQAAKRKLKEEMGISATPMYLGKFSYHIPPENEIVAVSSCRSDDPIRIDLAESFEASFYSSDELNAITTYEVAALWLRTG